jgi:hypothetical protein
MDNLQLKRLGTGLDAVMAHVMENPERLNTLQVLSLLGTVRAEGFHVGTALRSFQTRCAKAGLGDQLEEALEELRDYHVLGLLVNQPEMAKSTIQIDRKRVGRSLVVHWGRGAPEGRACA